MRVHGVLLISLHTHLNIGLDDFSKFAVYEIGNVFGTTFPSSLHWYVLIAVKINTSVRSTKQLPGEKRRGRKRGEEGEKGREGEGGRRGGWRRRRGNKGERRRRKVLRCPVIETSHQKTVDTLTPHSSPSLLLSTSPVSRSLLEVYSNLQTSHCQYH